MARESVQISYTSTLKGACSAARTASQPAVCERVEVVRGDDFDRRVHVAVRQADVDDGIPPREV